MNLKEIPNQIRVFPIEWNSTQTADLSAYIRTIGTNGASGNVFLVFH